ncbi:MAG: protein kinase, partial [Planctomycetales bacterium]|nr:protein kinase [Planctomycetales bacterium]
MPIEQLGPYRVEKVLGRGGMGAVYSAVHETTGDRVAVKILAESLADDPNFRERFGTEIETLKTLKHRNIVELVGYGEQDGLLFY